MDKKISIIIPVYNVEKYIEKCLNTVINQTYKNIEIIIIIDGSKDNSIKIVKKIMEKDNRIVLVERENKGVMQTRIEGIQIAKGDFVMFLDSDDWLDYDACLKLLEYQIKYDADIVKCSYIHANKKLSCLTETPKCDAYITKDAYIDKIYSRFIETTMFNPMWGQLIRRELAIKVSVENGIDVAEDLNYNLNLYTKSQSMVLVNDVLYYYRVNPESVTNSLNYEKIKKHLYDIIYVYGKLYDYIEVWGISNKSNKEKVSLRILKEITGRTLNVYRLEHLDKKYIDSILESVLNNKILDKITENLNKQKINTISSNKKFVMKAIYDKKKWRINLYGKIILYPYKKVEKICKLMGKFRRR